MPYRGMLIVRSPVHCRMTFTSKRNYVVIAFIELAERFSYYGTTVVFVSRAFSPYVHH